MTIEKNYNEYCFVILQNNFTETMFSRLLDLTRVLRKLFDDLILLWMIRNCFFWRAELKCCFMLWLIKKILLKNNVQWCYIFHSYILLKQKAYGFTHKLIMRSYDFVRWTLTFGKERKSPFQSVLYWLFQVKAMECRK